MLVLAKLSVPLPTAQGITSRKEVAQRHRLERKLSLRGLGEEGHGVLLHRRQLAPHIEEEVPKSMRRNATLPRVHPAPFKPPRL